MTSAQNTWVLVICLPLALTHCGAAKNEFAQHQSERRDSGASGAVQDSGVPGKQYVSTLGEGTANCTFGDAEEVPLLSMLPEYVIIFRHVDSPCDSLSSRVLIRNGNAAPVVVDGISVEPASFDIENSVGEFPQQIPAYGSLSLSIRHTAEVAEVFQQKEAARSFRC